MLPSLPQLPPRGLMAPQRSTVAPPKTEIFFNLPSAKNPTHRPSGEKNGSMPLTVPASNVACPWSSRRVANNCFPSAPRAGKTRRRPSGEMATVELTPVNRSGPRSTPIRTRGAQGFGFPAKTAHLLSEVPRQVLPPTTGAHRGERGLRWVRLFQFRAALAHLRYRAAV